jgi:3'-phosphoadenosine 5'-phosphosulfate (PAPS) 3'-phosphatase
MTRLVNTTGRYGDALAAAETAARAAGRIIRDFYDRAAATTYEKGDGSPVTDADLASDRAIRELLLARFPDIPILSEEGEDVPGRTTSPRCWVVDPLDGTEQFIRRTGEFDVLIALVVDGRPVAVAGYQPTTETLVTATAGGGAWVRRSEAPPVQIRLSAAAASPRLATSKWFGAPENGAIMRAVAAQLGSAPPVSTTTGFSPRMFLSPRDFDVMVGVLPGDDQMMAYEWDFVVADLVIHEAGGGVTDLAGNRFLYNKPVPQNVGGLIAASDPATHARVLAAARAARHRSSRAGIAV